MQNLHGWKINLVELSIFVFRWRWMLFRFINLAWQQLIGSLLEWFKAFLIQMHLLFFSGWFFPCFFFSGWFSTAFFSGWFFNCFLLLGARPRKFSSVWTENFFADRGKIFFFQLSETDFFSGRFFSILTGFREK